MILDGLLAFDLAFNAAQVAATYNSGNTLDLGIVNGLPASAVNGGGARDIGIGDDPAMKLLVLVTTTFTSAGAPTFQVAIQGAPDAGNNTPGAWTTMLTGSAATLAQCIAGCRLLDVDVPRQVPGQAIPRYLRLNYIIGAATITAGTVESLIVLDRHDLPLQSNATLGGYPAGITVAN